APPFCALAPRSSSMTPRGLNWVIVTKILRFASPTAPSHHALTTDCMYLRQGLEHEHRMFGYKTAAPLSIYSARGLPCLFFLHPSPTPRHSTSLQKKSGCLWKLLRRMSPWYGRYTSGRRF